MVFIHRLEKISASAVQLIRLIHEQQPAAELTSRSLTCARLSNGSIILLCSTAMSKDCRNSDTNGSTTFFVVLYFSWMIFNRPHFLTVPTE